MANMAVYPDTKNVLEVRNLKKHFPIREGLLRRTVGQVKAVDGVDFEIKQGETLGLVGESGSGKTTIGRTIVRLLAPSEGMVRYGIDGEMRDLSQLDRQEKRRIQQEIQLIFQDPDSSLNPRMKVVDIVGEPLAIHHLGDRRKRLQRVEEVLSKVGLKPEDMQQYPHQFSGGQKQRIGIARALGLNPKLIVCDEPVSALDVSIQAQVLNLLSDLQSELNLAYLFISHDLSVVEYISNRLMVMYLGKIVEVAPSDVLYREPKHPYTEGLLSAIPKYEVGAGRSKVALKGAIPNPADPPAGCVFHPRCGYAVSKCRAEVPSLKMADSGNGAGVACHRSHELHLTGYAE